MVKFAWFQDEDDLGNFPLIREISEYERGIKKLSDEFDGSRRQFWLCGCQREVA
jgi:hypothetical protein